MALLIGFCDENLLKEFGFVDFNKIGAARDFWNTKVANIL